MNTVAGSAVAAGSKPRRLHPIGLVAHKEWTELRRDARWRVLLVVTLLLMAAALALGLERSRHLDDVHEQAEAGDRQVWTAQGAKNPHAAAHFGQYAHKPVGPLAVADPGVDTFVGNAVWLEAHRQNDVQFRAARDGTLAARMGQLNLAFVLQTVLPLMALLLGFAAVSGEREQGTLRQWVALGLRPWHLLAGKALTCAAVLAALLIVACGGLTLGLALAGDEVMLPAGQGWRLVGLALAYGLYLLGFLLLALAVSAAVRSARLALVGLLMFWLLNSFLVPRAATDLVRAQSPLPSAQSMRTAMAEDKKQLFGHDEKHPGFIALRERVLREHGVARIEDLPVNFRALALREDDQAGYRIFDRHFGRLHAQIEAQDTRREWAGFVFPMLALQPLSMAMAGTDNRHHHDFVRAAEAHRRLIQAAISQDLLAHARPGQTDYVATPALWAHIPAFAYQAPAASWAWQSQGGNVAALLLWCVLCATAARLAAGRLQRL